MDKAGSYYTDIGSLILYERKKQSANAINGHYSLSFPDNYYTVTRFFYIDANKTIKIFESSGDENHTDFKATQEISLLQGGEIVVKNTK